MNQERRLIISLGSHMTNVCSLNHKRKTCLTTKCNNYTQDTRIPLWNDDRKASNHYASFPFQTKMNLHIGDFVQVRLVHRDK